MYHEQEEKMKPYPVEIEQMMRRFYTTLSEKDRRHYAAVEASKLGHGGVSYIARVLAACRRGQTSPQARLMVN